MIRDTRSMNADMAQGAVDGKIRFLRPDAGGPADETHAQYRANVLHTQHYGSMGVSQFRSDTVHESVPTSTPPFIGG